jgi:Mycothiol maleylpyruvate isomerase N-terminal domain
MDIPAMFGRAVAEFGTRVQQIGGDQWQAATPDDGWAVRDLVNHVVGEDLWAPPLLAGSTVAEVGDRFDGAMDRIVHLSFGDFPGRDYALQLFADHLIHAWDLACAIGADERLDPELVGPCATWFAAVEDAYRSAGVIADRPPVPAGADAQTRLLAQFGRRA